MVSNYLTIPAQLQPTTIQQPTIIIQEPLQPAITIPAQLQPTTIQQPLQTTAIKQPLQPSITIKQPLQPTLVPVFLTIPYLLLTADSMLIATVLPLPNVN